MKFWAIALAALAFSPSTLASESEEELRAQIRSALDRADVRFQVGDYAEAQVILLEVLDSTRQLQPSPELLRTGVLGTLAAISHNLGEFHRAAGFHHEALDAADQVLSEDDPRLFILVSNVASVHIELNEFELAEPYSRRALAILSESKSTLTEPERVYNLGYASWLLGSTQLGLNRPAAAKSHLEVALASFRALDIHPRHAADAQCKLGMAEGALGSSAAARKHLEQCVNTLSTVLPPGDPYLERARSELSSL